VTLQICIVGSGPAGCYAAEKLQRDAPDAAIDIIERLPTPFGLIRAGVAPDHQSTKAVARILERVLARPGTRFWGNVEVGRDLSLDALREAYDAVILATGAPLDRRLGIAGETLPGILGSAAFTRWYNSHPDHTAAPSLAGITSVAIIGNGNVALDVVRLLAKSPAELAQSDIDPAVEATLGTMRLREIHVCGRRGPAEASFSPLELGEFGTLERAQPFIDAADAAVAVPDAAVGAHFADFAAAPPAEKPIAIRFHFRARPAAFRGTDRVSAVEFSGQRNEGGRYVDSGERFVLPAELVIRCIGYETQPCCELRPEAGIFANENGRIAPGLYVVGWAKRGPTGTIPTNRSEAHQVAQRLLAETQPAGRPGRAALEKLLAERAIRVVDHAGWQRIDAAERAAAAPGRPRRKFTSIDGMLAG
jgi:ferredoxin--NADP+ reductase